MSARLLLLVAITVLIGACSRDGTVRCATSSRYLEAGSAELLRVPDDLDIPDETEALAVPGRTPPRETDADTLACLEYSPAFLGADEEEDDDEDD